MAITVTDYLDVISSWCFWSEPTWAELKKRYDGKVDFQWKIALMDKTGMPVSRKQEEWFYRRSGMLMRSGPVFIGGNSGIVAPAYIGFGEIVPAGTTVRSYVAKEDAAVIEAVARL